LISHPLTHPLPLEGERGIEFMGGPYSNNKGLNKKGGEAIAYNYDTHK